MNKIFKLVAQVILFATLISALGANAYAECSDTCTSGVDIGTLTGSDNNSTSSGAKKFASFKPFNIGSK